MMALFHKKPGQRAEQIAIAEAANTEAQEALREAHRRRPTVESRVQAVRKRRLENHFGEDFRITMTPRGTTPDVHAR